MSKEESQIWRDYKDSRKKKRWQNHEQSLKILAEAGIEITEHNASLSHYGVGKVSIWLTTGKWHDYETGKSGRGVKSFIKYIKK